MYPQETLWLMNKITFETKFQPDQDGLHTFISALTFRSYYEYLSREKRIYNSHIYVDGVVLRFLFRCKYGVKPEKLNFDISGVAPLIFDKVIKESSKVIFVGGTQSEIDTFKRVICSNWKFDLNKLTFYNGFDHNILMNIQGFSEYAIISMGTPLQERIGNYLLSQGKVRTVFTSGAFISQTARGNRLNYYPEVISAMNIRFLYRMVKEKRHYIRLIKAFISIPFIYRRITLRSSGYLSSIDRK